LAQGRVWPRPSATEEGRRTLSDAMGWAGDGGGGGGGKGGGGKGGGTKKNIGDPSKLVWLGNVPEGTTFQDVLAFAREVGDAKWAEVFKGSAAVAFDSAESAATAVAMLNGVSLGGVELVADTWEKKAPGAAGKGGGSKGGGSKGGWGKGGCDGGGAIKPPQPSCSPPQGTWQPQFQKKGGKDGKGGKGSKGGKGGWGGGKATVTFPSRAVWVGNVPEGTTYKELLDLARQVGDAKWAEVYAKGTGVIGYDSEETAAIAIEALNGAVLGSATILADAYEKKNKQ